MNFLRNDPTYKERRRDLRKNHADAEKAFWIHVRNRRFHGLKFFRQYSVGAYILDFYCPERKLAVELDGGQHNDDKSKEYDTVRSEYLRTHGIDVLRFWNHEVLLDVRSVFAKLGEQISPS